MASTFDWHDIDPALRIRLCLEAAEDPEETATLLADRYGSRPDERLVAERWEVLRDEWLVVDAVARSRVVAALREAGLGERDLPVDRLATQMAYLRSCRNRGRLRSIVASAFVELPRRRASGDTKRSPTDWATFTAGLTLALEQLGAEGRYRYLLLSVRGTGATATGGAGGPGGPGGPATPARRGSSYYVQFAALPEGRLRVEAVSNTFLTPEERLSVAAQRRLVELGWQPPTHLPGQEDQDPAGSPNYFRDIDPSTGRGDVAAMVATTLHEVYRAESPDFLGYQCFSAEGHPVEVPELGVDRGPDLVNVMEDAESLLPTPRNSAELSAEVDRALSVVISGDSIVRDDDGDIPILFGTTTVFVRILQDAPVVRIFALVLTDLAPSAVLIDTINELNQRYVFAKVFWNGSAVVMSIDVPGSPFVASHLVQAIGMLGNAADQLDEELQSQFGGRTMLGAYEPAPKEEPTPGYL